ncbi:predicted protein [Naegleria gruberi]|uniref:Predicted protein n=1 Tax=Naegleria gruberi TaxID=5762 RepID=D2VCL6_NAEGR|nr:uncharacterized protein NAEGRDRAFT_66616 [Naegleria gruberi]EFC45439.1 predicted protein [Naegleria gruberi]|eukprot:XP_002678183.1 predicted protein [Naegleria gruberi strain NEG-M]
MSRYNSNFLSSLSTASSSNTTSASAIEAQMNRLAAMQLSLSERSTPTTPTPHTKSSSHHHHHHHSTVYATGSNIDQMLGVKVNTYLLKKSQGEPTTKSTKATLEKKKNLIQSSSDSYSDSSSEDELDQEVYLDSDDEDLSLDSDNEDQEADKNAPAGKLIHEFRLCDAAEYISVKLIDQGDYIEDIKLCYASTFFITKKKRVFMIGNNFLEIGFEKILIIPREVTWEGCQGNNKMKEMACGHFHLVILTEQKEILVGGNNNYGQLGDNFEKKSSYIDEEEDDVEESSDSEEEDGENYFQGKTFEVKEIELKKPPNNLNSLGFFFLELKGDVLESVFCGAFFTIFVTKLRRIYICGQIGFDDSNILREPTKIRFFDSGIPVSKIFCGSDDIVFVTVDKKVYGFSLLEPETITQKPSHFSQIEYFLDEHQTSVMEFGLGHSIFVTKENQVYCYGSNCDGECGMGEKESINKISLNDNMSNLMEVGEKIVSAVCGATMSTFLSNYGSIFVCGDNSEGQLGCLGKQPSSKVPVKVPSLFKQDKTTNPSRLRVFSGYHNTFILQLPEIAVQP